MPKNRARMSEESFNSRKLIKSGLKLFNNNISCVPIPQKLLKDARNSNNTYKMQLERNRIEKQKKREETEVMERSKLEIAKKPRPSKKLSTN